MIKVLELFAGIGACSKALTNLGIEHTIVDAVEIDKFAIASFNAVHGTNFEPQDITKWDKDIECDLIMHGSPCQDFSIAGKQAGGDKDAGTRSSLMYETLRIVQKTLPKYVIWENVKNLLSKKHRHNFDAYQKAMEDMGYINHYQVLNAKDYGVPQNRERVFTVSVRGDLYDREFVFPSPIPLEKKLKDVLEKNVDEKYFVIIDDLYKNRSQREYSETSPALRSGRQGLKVVASRGRGKNNEQHLEARKDDLTNTITSVQKDNYVAIRTANTKGYDLAKDGDGMRIRKLTPKECWRLMGFDDQSFERAAKVNSNTQLYKQAGNSIVVPVLEAILNNLMKGEK